MFSKVDTAAICGVDCVPVEVEADVSTGLPMFSMVGYLNYLSGAQDHSKSIPGRYQKGRDPV